MFDLAAALVPGPSATPAESPTPRGIACAAAGAASAARASPPTSHFLYRMRRNIDVLLSGVDCFMSTRRARTTTACPPSHGADSACVTHVTLARTAGIVLDTIGARNGNSRLSSLRRPSPHAPTHRGVVSAREAHPQGALVRVARGRKPSRNTSGSSSV